MKRVACVVGIVLLASPVFVLADVFDEPFFRGALGRVAYGVPQEYVHLTGWENELRFSFPPDTGERVVGFFLSQGEKAFARTRDFGNASTVLAGLAVESLLERVADGLRFPTVTFKAEVFTAAASVSSGEYKEKNESPSDAILMDAVPARTPHCSRAEGMARYTWCLMNP